MMDKESPDLVLLDVVMPEMSGYEVCRRIRENEERRLLPIVMVTALDSREERVRGIEAGADDFLESPIRQAELLARVRSLLRIKELHDTVEQQAAAARRLEQNTRGAGGGAGRRAGTPGAPSSVSSLLTLPRRSSRAARTFSRITGATSRWSSSIFAASRHLQRRWSPKRSWACFGASTPRWAG